MMYTKDQQALWGISQLNAELSEANQLSAQLIRNLKTLGMLQEKAETTPEGEEVPQQTASA